MHGVIPCGYSINPELKAQCNSAVRSCVSMFSLSLGSLGLLVALRYPNHLCTATLVPKVRADTFHICMVCTQSGSFHCHVWVPFCVYIYIYTYMFLQHKKPRHVMPCRGLLWLLLELGRLESLIRKCLSVDRCVFRQAAMRTLSTPPKSTLNQP